MSSVGPPKKSAARAAAAAAAGVPAGASATDGDTSALAAELVVAHLLHECQGETAAAVLEAGPEIASSSTARERLRALKRAVNGVDLGADAARRAGARDHVRAGRMQDAIAAADQLLGCAGALERRDPALHFELLCQHFVELVRARTVNAACVYARAELTPRAERAPRTPGAEHRQEDILASMKDLFALIAYNVPEESSLAHLLHVERRERLADRLAGALFAARFGALAAAADARSALEKALRQTRLVNKKLDEYCPQRKRAAALNGSAGSPLATVVDAEVAREEQMNDD